jgi:hypothetical protein
MDRRGWLCILVLGLFYLGPAEYPPVARGPSASLVFIMCSSSSFEFAHRSFEVLGLCCREFVGPSTCGTDRPRRVHGLSAVIGPSIG